MRTIYEPRGKAREYAPLALNLYEGCGHGCSYCYVPRILHKTPEDFRSPKPREGIIDALRKDAPKFHDDRREILISFTSDPYQPLDREARLTRRALQVLDDNQCRATVLTKGGMWAVRDFDILQAAEWSFGTTLIFWRKESRVKFEPRAAPSDARMKAIREAKRRGIRTWVSLEPVIDPREALIIIDLMHDYVDHWKIGKINYLPEVEREVDWSRFLGEVLERMSDYDADYYIKDGLAKYGEVPWEGRRKP